MVFLFLIFMRGNNMNRTAKAWRVTSHPREDDFIEAEAEGKTLGFNTGNKSEDHEIDPSFSQESLSSSLCLTTFRVSHANKHLQE